MTKAFLARDKNGELYLYADKPTIREDGTYVGKTFVSDSNYFKEIKKGDCVKCEIFIKS